MITRFEKSFLKDIRRISTPGIRGQISVLIETMQKTQTLKEIQGIKKLKGHPHAYRIRIGDYRVGFFFIENEIIFSRCLDRKDIYKWFPPG